jgi:hypothetical protein
VSSSGRTDGIGVGAGGEPTDACCGSAGVGGEADDAGKEATGEEATGEEGADGEAAGPDADGAADSVGGDNVDWTGTTPALETRRTGEWRLKNINPATAIAAAAAVRPMRSHRRARSSREITRTTAGQSA